MDKGMIFTKWFMIIMVVLTFLLLFFVMIISFSSRSMEHDIKTIKIECYDKFGSEIEDLTCKKEIGCNYKWDILNHPDCNKDAKEGKAE